MGNELPLEEPDPSIDELTRQIIGAAIEVHRHLGPGFEESIYEAALAVEFDLRGIVFERQVPVQVVYKGKSVGERRVDFIVGQSVLVELKAVEGIASVHKAQVHSYLKITKLKIGLLMNFNEAILKDGMRRIIRK